MWTDHRFAGSDQLYLCPPKDAFVRVPDLVLKSSVFLGLDSPKGIEFGATGYVVWTGYGLRHPAQPFAKTKEEMATTHRYPFFFLVTAAHVAEKLEGLDFYVRCNKRDGSLAEAKQTCENALWWYHATEREAVDAAAMLLPLESILELDIAPIPVTMFVGEEAMQTGNLGIGDEVFVAGLFRNAKGVSRNIPIIRIGNVAMMPREKILFPKQGQPDRLIYADLLESRSIGGLSGSPVFIRETVNIQTGPRFKRGFSLVGVNSPTAEIEGIVDVQLAGVGRFHFFGSMIGHWQVDVELSNTKKEAVNLGIAPMVPANKILEVLSQPGLLEIMNTISLSREEQQKQQEGMPTLDSEFESGQKRPTQTTAEGLKIPVPTSDEFYDLLRKASRKV
jgi:hypothetical protein